MHETPLVATVLAVVIFTAFGLPAKTVAVRDRLQAADTALEVIEIVAEKQARPA